MIVKFTKIIKIICEREEVNGGNSASVDEKERIVFLCMQKALKPVKSFS